MNTHGTRPFIWSVQSATDGVVELPTDTIWIELRIVIASTAVAINFGGREAPPTSTARPDPSTGLNPGDNGVLIGGMGTTIEYVFRGIESAELNTFAWSAAGLTQFTAYGTVKECRKC